jgi:hypothetical protein
LDQQGTLKKHFAYELRLGKAEANIRVGEQIYKIAMGDPTLLSTAIAAMMFWAKCHLGRRQAGLVDTGTGRTFPGWRRSGGA